MERADKVIAKLMVVSRSDARRMIKIGHVKLNGEKLKNFDTKVSNDDILIVDGKQLINKSNVYIIMNKEQGVVCDDKSSSPYAIERLPETLRRKDLFCVGRLDKDTTGLLLITNDGQFSHDIISPKKHIIKRYYCELAEEITDKNIYDINKGLTLSDGTKLLPSSIELGSDRKKVIFCISEGKYHQIKRMAGAIENKVLNLQRISIGNLEIPDNLLLGNSIEITQEQAYSIFD